MNTYDIRNYVESNPIILDGVPLIPDIQCYGSINGDWITIIIAFYHSKRDIQINETYNFASLLGVSNVTVSPVYSLAPIICTTMEEFIAEYHKQVNRRENIVDV